MNETKFDWDDLRLFLAVAQFGGLSAAARHTGKSAPTLGRRMLALERLTGRELFHRLPRGYALTDDGKDLLAKAKALEAQVAPIIETDPARAHPLVKISAGVWVTHLLCAYANKIIGQDPIRLRFIASDAVADIGRREALIGIRNHRPDGPGLAGRRITKVRFAVYALGPDIDTWVRVLGQTPSAKWVETAAQGQACIEATNPRNALDLVLAGNARAVLPTFIGARNGDLVQLSPEIDDLEHDQWLVTHHEDRFMPDVRKVIDRLYAVLHEVGASKTVP